MADCEGCAFKVGAVPNYDRCTLHRKYIPSKATDTRCEGYTTHLQDWQESIRRKGM